jgi:hypothetical protein
MNLHKLTSQILATALIAAGVTAVTASPAMAAAVDFPLYDANGVQRSSMTYNTDSQFLMACYPNGFKLTIEEQFENGQIESRAVEQFQCNVATPYGYTGRVVAVRGLIDDYANPWHPVA